MQVFRPGYWVVLALAVFPAVGLAADGVSLPAPTLHEGDSWVFDEAHTKGTTGFSENRTDTVIERTGSDSMVIGVKLDGSPKAFEDHMMGPDWSLRLLIDDRQTTTAQPFHFPMSVGQTWVSDWTDPRSSGVQTSAHFHKAYKVVGWEDVTAPAGVFHCLKIEESGWGDVQVSIPATAGTASTAAPGSATSVAHAQAARRGVMHVTTYGALYYAPEVKYFVKSLEEVYNTSNVLQQRDIRTLVSYKVAP